MTKLPPHVRRIAVVVVLGSVMSTLDTTIVNVALAQLADKLHSDLNSIQWVVTAYLLALAAVIPVGGWAVRRFGAFRVYVTALALFGLGSALCAAAATVDQLIVFRVVQGVGGGLIMPTGMTMLVRASPPQLLARVMSVIGTAMVLAPILGPTVGGLLLEHVGWNAIFAINVPVGLVAIFAAVRLLPRDAPVDGTTAPLDWIGLLLACTGVVMLTYGLSRSTATSSLLSREVLVPAATGLLLIGLFVVHARRRVERPLLDMRLYSAPSYAAASVVMFCLNGALFGSMILLPLYLQDVRQLGAATTGLLLIPQGVGAAIGMNRSAVVESRLGSARTALVGMAVVVVCTSPFLLVDDRTPYTLLCTAMVLRGVGVGLAVNGTNTAAFSALDGHQVVDATPQINVIQRVGATLGTAVIAVVLQSRMPSPGSSASASARAFSETYKWVMAITLVALGSAMHLVRVKRRASARAGAVAEVASGVGGGQLLAQDTT